MSSSGGFGGRQSRPFDPNDIPWDQVARWSRLVVVGMVVAIVLLLGMSMFYRIDASDEGVVLQFGKKHETVPPGLHWKLPWPIQKVYMVPVLLTQDLKFGYETEQPGRVTKFAPKGGEDLAVAEMLTGDLNLGRVEWIVQYKVKDPVQYLFEVGSSGPISNRVLPSGTTSDVNPAVPDVIRDISESVMRKLVGDLSIDYVLTIGREQIAQEAEKLIQEELDAFKTGVDIITVELQTTSPPTEAVQDAFQDVNRARQRKERVVNEALGMRNSQIPAARGKKDQTISEAEGYKNRVVLSTTGKINAFLAQLAEYEKAPEVTLKRLYLEAMEEILSNVGSKTIIDDSVKGVLPMLNLDQGASTSGVRRGATR